MYVKHLFYFLIFILVVIIYWKLFTNNSANHVQEGEFTWHVFLDMDDNVKYLWSCTGSLISAKWIVTAAHCLERTKNVMCKFGSIIEQRPMAQIISKEFYQHPSYDKHFERDIALIKLPYNIKFTETIKPISLPIELDKADDLLGEICTVYGVGRFRHNQENTPEYLRYGQVRVITGHKCSNIYGFFRNTKNEICAIQVYKYQTICMGDTGSGLLLKRHGKFYLVGISSFGIEGCGGVPTVYQSVQTNLDWILKMTKY